MYGMEADAVKAAIPEKDIKHDLAMNKAIDLVKSAAVITDVKEKKPAAKKTSTAKKTTTKKAAEKTEETAE